MTIQLHDKGRILSTEDSDDAKKPEELIKNKFLKDATKEVLDGLTARQAKILRMKFGVDMQANHSLEDIGKQFEVTRQRIREIEAKALRKLRRKDDDSNPDDDDPVPT